MDRRKVGQKEYYGFIILKILFSKFIYFKIKDSLIFIGIIVVSRELCSKKIIINICTLIFTLFS